MNQNLSRYSQNLAREESIMRRAIADLIAAGHALTVFDGECQTVKRSRDESAIFAAMRTTDSDTLLTHKPTANETAAARYENHGRDSFVLFVYGNDACDLIADYGVSLESVLSGALALQESFA